MAIQSKKGDDEKKPLLEGIRDTVADLVQSDEQEANLRGEIAEMLKLAVPVRRS